MGDSLFDELKWRGLLYNFSPNIKELLKNKMQVGYCGFDPTSVSLHVGSLVPIIMLCHFQRFGHKPIALIGGATGMIGDPSGKTKERPLLDEESLEKNINGIREQLNKYVDFSESKPNGALLLNNYNWFKDFSFINFAREIGKHITVNYMLAKDSVKQRIRKDNNDDGISFAEFAYQLVQGYDFLHLYRKYGCKVQLGGSDQWGNITTGMELIRRKEKGEVGAFTCPLTTDVNGKKFGKSESGENIWLDSLKTSPYIFYQFWLNQSDQDAEKFLPMYTFLSKNQIIEIIREHKEEPQLRILQKSLAKEVTTWVHGVKALERAEKASQILFGKATKKDLQKLDKEDVLTIFSGVPQVKFSNEILRRGIDVVELLTECGVYMSKGEARRALKQNGLSINNEKVKEGDIIDSNELFTNEFMLIQKGKKNYYLLRLL